MSTGETWTGAKSKACIDELKTLASTGVFKPPPARLQHETAVTRLNLNLCHDCNMRCTYCFAKGGTYGHESHAMPRAVAFRLIDRFLEQLPDHISGNLILFGGEPLLAKDLLFEIVQHVQDRSAGQRQIIIIDVFTNGTLLDSEIEALILETPNIRLTVSLDGPPEMNDRQRLWGNKTSVSRYVIERLSALSPEVRSRTVVRCTVTDLPPKIVERASYFLDYGLENIVIEPVTIEEEGVTRDLFKGFCDELPKIVTLYQKMINNKKRCVINILSEPLSRILNGPGMSTELDKLWCPAGKSYLSAAANGDIFPCHYFVGNRDYVLGTEGESSLPRVDLLCSDDEKDLSPLGHVYCQDCWLRYQCHGACPYKVNVLGIEEPSAEAGFCYYMRERTRYALSLIGIYYGEGRSPFYRSWKTVLNE